MDYYESLTNSLTDNYLALIKARYWISRHPFLKHLAFPYFWSDSIKNLYANSKRVEVVCYEVSCGYAALIQIDDFLKVVPFFLDHPIYLALILVILVIWWMYAGIYIYTYLLSDQKMWSSLENNFGFAETSSTDWLVIF